MLDVKEIKALSIIDEEIFLDRCKVTGEITGCYFCEVILNCGTEITADICVNLVCEIAN